MIPPFEHRGYKLAEAIDGLMAYDGGATDSGIHDPDLKKALGVYLHKLSDEDSKRFDKETSEFAMNLLKDGYGLEGVKEFIEWLSDEFSLDI